MSCFNIYRIIRLTFPLRERTLTIQREGVDITSDLTYSWSTDGVCWTDFTTYTNYTTIIPNLESDYYLRIRFSGDIPELYLDGKPYTCFSVVLDDSQRFEITACEDNEFSFFDNINCALQLQQQMADKIVCLFGIQVYYFRVMPEETTRDLTFKEYTLHGVEAVKHLKMIIPDGQMPSSKPVFTDFDFDWETDWEVELSKTQFARAFGETAYPKQRDFIYVPMMKRMYEVNSAYDEKEGQMMWQSTTWKLGLIKWNEKTNIDYTGFEDVIDKFAVNQFDVLPEVKEQDIESGYNDARTPQYIPNNIHNVFLEDGVRHSLTETTVREFRINHKNISITQHIYDFKQSGVVNYQKTICGDNGTMSFVIVVPQLTEGDERLIVEAGEVRLYVTKQDNEVCVKDLMGNSIVLLEGNTYIVNYVWNRGTFSVELSAYVHGLGSKGSKFLNLPLYKRKPDMYTMEHVQTVTGVYCNDYSQSQPQRVALYPGPLLLTNFKLYNTALSNEELKNEMLKYSTKHESIVINDNCIPFDTGFGSSNK